MSPSEKYPNRNVLVLGAGKVGGTVADMLAEYHRLPVTLADRVLPRGEPGDALVKRVALDVEDARALAVRAGRQSGRDQRLALPSRRARGRAPPPGGVHYFDLTEDVAATDAIRGFAAGRALRC